MEIKIGKTCWNNLRKCLVDIRRSVSSNHTREIRKKLMTGFADAIDAEIKKLEMAGDNFHGMINASVVLKLEPCPLLEFDTAKRRNVLADLDDILTQQENTKKYKIS